MDLSSIYSPYPQIARSANLAVNYGSKKVSDSILRNTLEMISYNLGRQIIITSGDRRSVVNRNNSSHHLMGRAADFYVQGMSLEDSYLKIIDMNFLSRGYQVIYHTEQTRAPHIHIGRYLDNRPSSFIVDNGQIL